MHAHRIVSACAAAITALAALAPGSGQAQNATADSSWPSRPIRLVVPFPPGGGSDNVARLVSKSLTDAFGQAVVVENRPGAAATLGARAVARSAPDGYTLLLGNAAVITLTPQLRDAGFDPVSSFTPVATVSGSYAVVAVRKDFPARNFTEFVELAKREPGRVTCGTSGSGGATHLGCAILADRLGIELRAVHYKGSVPAANDLIAGIIDLIIDPAAVPHARAGRIRAIAARGLNDGPHPEFPGVPSLAEVGAQSGTETWFGVLAPAGTAPDIVERIAQVLERMTKASDYASTLLAVSMYPLYIGPRAFAERIPRDLKTYGDIIRKTGIKAD
jgi:tripartite-type tricarboxylate transporter receptor subunit TctC